jgi:hypothetical protein
VLHLALGWLGGRWPPPLPLQEQPIKANVKSHLAVRTKQMEQIGKQKRWAILCSCREQRNAGKGDRWGHESEQKTQRFLYIKKKKIGPECSIRILRLKCGNTKNQASMDG